MTEREQLRALLVRNSVRRGEFTLSSGARSTYYIDARRTTMSGAGQRLIGSVALEALAVAGWEPQAVGGLTLGADPVAYAVARAANDAGRTLDAFTVRKAAKQHGMGKRVEGCFDAGQRVVVVEDVITTGESALNAVAAVEAEGGSVLGVLALVDRQEGGRERVEATGLDVVALFSASELLATP